MVNEKTLQCDIYDKSFGHKNVLIEQCTTRVK